MLDHLTTIVIVLDVCLLLSGCDSGGSAPPGIAAGVFAVMSAAWKARALFRDPLINDDPKKEDIKEAGTDYGEHVKFFLRERAKAHLAVQPNQDAAATAIAAEYDQVKAFIDAHIGLDSGNPKPLITGDDGPPTHLDFTDMLRSHVNDAEPSDDQVKQHNRRRWSRAVAVVWRGAALEPAIWTPNFSADAMKELVDRRVRIAERTLYQLSGSMRGGHLKPAPDKPHGPWPDGFRVRPFEYPSIPSSFENKVGAANVGPGKVWVKNQDGSLLVYAEGNGRRIRKAAENAFVPAVTGDPYFYDVIPTVPDPAAALDDLFEPSTDLWDRSWIFCDHVIAALHIEALRFGKRRRTSSDTGFNAIITSHPRSYAQLRWLLPGRLGDPRLLSDDSARPPGEPHVFNNGPMPQVQLGDHIVVWNSIMYGLLSDGAWSLENAVVVEIKSDFRSNDVGKDVKVMGHGSDDATTRQGALQYTGVGIDYFRRDLTDSLNLMLTQARKVVNDAPAGTDHLRFNLNNAPLFKWAPFNEAWVVKDGAPQDPWWIRVPYLPEGDWNRAIGRDATLRTLPESVIFDPTAGHAPLPAAAGDPATAAFFPLWIPAQQGKWHGYIQRHKDGHPGTRFELEPTRFYGKNIPGLVVPEEFDPQAKSPFVYTVRPMVARI